MRWAIERGLRRFDFGDASPDSSLGKFKRQWACEPVGEFVYILSGQGGNPLGEAVRRQNPTLTGDAEQGLVGRAWDRAPLALTRLAGSIVYRL
jgi:hypothetical protein